MKNILLIIAVALFVAPGISAQVILTQSSYPVSVIGTDSLKITTSASPFPSLAAISGGMWDMSIVIDTTSVYFAYRIPSATHQFADSNVYSLFGNSYLGNVQSSITSSGILDYGINIQKASYTLFPITSTLADSLFIDSQSMVYSSPYTKIAFPATYHSVWSSAYTANLNFQLSLSDIVFTYIHTPGIVKRYTTEKDTVTGWGKMSIKDAGGNPSAYLSVLQVQTTITTADSFFINDTAFSTSLLTLLGITQGTVITTYQQNYYRPQEITALASVTFTDATYSHPKSAITHIQRLATDAVSPVVNEAGIHVYPNPVTGSIVSIDLPATPGEWSCELVNIAGSIIKSTVLQTNGNRAHFTLPSAVMPGAYYLKLYNNGMQYCTNAIEVIR